MLVAIIIILIILVVIGSFIQGTGSEDPPEDKTPPRPEELEEELFDEFEDR